MQFRYFDAGKHWGQHRLFVGHDETPHTAKMGYMAWDDKTGEVNMISVKPEYRGLKVASALWDKAHQLSEATGIVAPKHSTEQSEAGAAWAKSVDKGR
jgi:ribosomal protein S18 acetylase RimI-like enzyme